MAGVGEEEGKFSHLSSEQRESLASQGREVLSRRRQRQLRGVKESADWTAAVQSEVEERLGEMRESHEREIETIKTNGEEEKSRELSLLSEELTKQYKYHVEQLESRLQRATEGGVPADVTGGGGGGGIEAFKRDVEQQASIQVQQYYQQYRTEVEELQSELDRISEEKDLAFEENRSLLGRVGDLERAEEWECEKVSLEQRVQEADTKVLGLERMLAEKRGEVERAVEERDETRDILATRNKEKMALSRHFTHQIQGLEQEREEARESATGLENELLSSRTDLTELRELLERRETEKRQLAEQIHKSVNVSQYVSVLEREKQELLQELASAERTGELEASRLSEELEGFKGELVQLGTQNSVIFRENSELKEKVGVLESQLFAVRDYKSAVEERMSELQSAMDRSESEARELSQRLSEAERGKHEADSVISSLRCEVEGKKSKVMEVSEEEKRLRGELDLKVREVENLREEVRNIKTQRNESILDLTHAQERISLLQTELEREELVVESKSNFPQLVPTLNTRNEDIIRLSKELTALQTYKKSMEEEKVYLDLRGRQQDSLIRRTLALREAEERDYQILLQRMPATRN